MKLQFERGITLDGLPFWLIQARARKLTEIEKSRPKNESERLAYARQLDREGFTEAAQYWRDIW